jgi:hypothetical protein
MKDSISCKAKMRLQAPKWLQKECVTLSCAIAALLE